MPHVRFPFFSWCSLRFYFYTRIEFCFSRVSERPAQDQIHGEREEMEKERVCEAGISFRGKSLIIESSGFIFNSSRVLYQLNKQFWPLTQKNRFGQTDTPSSRCVSLCPTGVPTFYLNRFCNIYSSRRVLQRVLLFKTKKNNNYN